MRKFLQPFSCAGSTKSLSTDLKQKGSQEKVSLTSIRPPVERSNSSPTVRQFQQPRQGSTSNHRKIGGSQHSSPSSRHSTPSSSGPRKGFTSPSQGASPRLIRGHSGSSISSPTPTIYDRRRRSDYSSSSRGKVLIFFYFFISFKSSLLSVDYSTATFSASRTVAAVQLELLIIQVQKLVFVAFLQCNIS